VKLPDSVFDVIDWEREPPTKHPGETGSATWRTRMLGDIRIRLVEYSSNYLADHWCERGHILMVLDGELTTELKDGRSFSLKPGMSYQVSDSGDSPHRSRSIAGTRLFIVD
jgi:hypothetical protein